MGRYRYVTVEAEVDLSEFDTEDLIEELEIRGNDYNTHFVDADGMRKLLEDIFNSRRLGKDYQKSLDELIFGVLGRIV